MLPLGMLLIIEFHSELIIKNGLRFFEGNGVLHQITDGLLRIPGKYEFRHIYIVLTSYVFVNTE